MAGIYRGERQGPELRPVVRFSIKWEDFERQGFLQTVALVAKPFCAALRAKEMRGERKVEQRRKRDDDSSRSVEGGDQTQASRRQSSARSYQRSGVPRAPRSASRRSSAPDPSGESTQEDDDADDSGAQPTWCNDSIPSPHARGPGPDSIMRWEAQHYLAKIVQMERARPIERRSSSSSCKRVGRSAWRRHSGVRCPRDGPTWPWAITVQ